MPSVPTPMPTLCYAVAQARGAIIVSSSPEILCRVDRQRVVTNRPLAGTRRRGATDQVRAGAHRGPVKGQRLGHQQKDDALQEPSSTLLC